MPNYEVSFFKEVCSDTGADVITRQGVYQVYCDTERQAEQEAKRWFCHERSISSWTINADRFSIERLGRFGLRSLRRSDRV